MMHKVCKDEERRRRVERRSTRIGSSVKTLLFTPVSPCFSLITSRVASVVRAVAVVVVAMMGMRRRVMRMRMGSIETLVLMIVLVWTLIKASGLGKDGGDGLDRGVRVPVRGVSVGEHVAHKRRKKV